MKYFILGFFFALSLQAKNINDYRIFCRNIFSQSVHADKEILQFQNNDQQIRVYGSALRDLGNLCQASEVSFDEITITTQAQLYSPTEIEHQLGVITKSSVKYSGESLWSNEGLKDLQLINLPGNEFEIKTKLQKNKSTLMANTSSYIAARNLSAGTFLETAQLDVIPITNYKDVLALNNFIPIDGMEIVENIPKGTVLLPRMLKKSIVEAGKQVNLFLVSPSMELQAVGKLMNRSQVGDTVSVMTKNQKIVQGILIRSDAVRIDL